MRNQEQTFTPEQFWQQISSITQQLENFRQNTPTIRARALAGEAIISLETAVDKYERAYAKHEGRAQEEGQQNSQGQGQVRRSRQSSRSLESQS